MPVSTNRKDGVVFNSDKQMCTCEWRICIEMTYFKMNLGKFSEFSEIELIILTHDSNIHDFSKYIYASLLS